MDIRHLITPAVEDRVAFEEFADVFSDRVVEIEQTISKLKRVPGDRELAASLFRAVHNIKGEASFCRLPFMVGAAQPMESILARIRSGEIAFSDLLGEMLLLAMDRLEQIVEALWNGKETAPFRLLELVQGMEKISGAPAAKTDEVCGKVIEAVTGFAPLMTAHPTQTKAPVTHRPSDPAAADLAFFRTLALQYEGRSPLFKGRTTRVLRLALETNKAKGNVVDPKQLEAAVYMHDLGMMLLPESIWLKAEKFSADDKAAMRLHPMYGAGLLERMPGWLDAARIVAEHHEMPDGKGYPNALQGADICDGAKILAIVDAFEAVMLKHINRGQTRSVLRAIAEINASGQQFAPEWIEPFNEVIRRSLHPAA